MQVLRSFLWGFRSAERVSFPTMEKKLKDRRGPCRKHPVFSMAPSPDPRFTGVVGGGQGFRSFAKSALLTATHHFGQKSVLFYGSNMIRPPRRRGLRILSPDTPYRVRAYSLRRSSSPNRTHFVGLRFGFIYARLLYVRILITGTARHADILSKKRWQFGRHQRAHFFGRFHSQFLP